MNEAIVQLIEGSEQVKQHVMHELLLIWPEINPHTNVRVITRAAVNRQTRIYFPTDSVELKEYGWRLQGVDGDETGVIVCGYYASSDTLYVYGRLRDG